MVACPSRGRRAVALAAVLLAQTAFFLVLLKRPVAFDADNNRYEIAGLNLARGRGLSTPLAMTHDREVYDWVCSRHPDACAPDGTHPTALYPPGFSILVGAVYFVFGQSPAVVAGLQLVLLLVMFVLFEALAARFLDGVGYWFALAVAATYPFLARQATLLGSDHLHVVLLFASLASLALLRPGIVRGIAFGGLMAATTLARPYSLLVFPVLWLWPSVRRAAGASRREWLVVAAAFALPFVVWTARNYHWYGRFMPLTSGGPGVLLMHSTMEWEASRYLAADNPRFYSQLEESIGGYDHTSHEGDRRLMAEAKRRIVEHPGRFALIVLSHVPKVWISLGTQNGFSRAWPLLVVYLGGLWLLGVYGGWILRSDERWHLFILTIASYWLFLLYTPGEARRTLPLRLPMLLVAGVAVSHAVEAWRRSRSPAAAPRAATADG
jgi:hypothetical protein